jgi:hypothetical protein
VRQLPVLLGRLSVDPWNTTAAFQVFQSRSDLVAVLAAVRADGGSDGIAAPLQELVDALRAVSDAGVTEQSAGRIRADLAAVGRAVQPACGYPT